MPCFGGSVKTCDVEMTARPPRKPGYDNCDADGCDSAPDGPPFIAVVETFLVGEQSCRLIQFAFRLLPRSLWQVPSGHRYRHKQGAADFHSADAVSDRAACSQRLRVVGARPGQR